MIEVSKEKRPSGDWLAVARKAVEWGKLLVGGALGGLAVINVVSAVQPSDSVEQIAMAVGAAVMAAAIKYYHII